MEVHTEIENPCWRSSLWFSKVHPPFLSLKYTTTPQVLPIPVPFLLAGCMGQLTLNIHSKRDVMYKSKGMTPRSPAFFVVCLMLLPQDLDEWQNRFSWSGGQSHVFLYTEF